MPNCVYAPDNLMADVFCLEADFIRFFLKDLSPVAVKGYLYFCFLAGKEDCYSTMAELASNAGLTEEECNRAVTELEEAQLLHVAKQSPPVIELRSVRSAALLRTGYLPRAFADYQDYFSGLRALFYKRELTQREMEAAVDWVQVYGLSKEAALLLVQQCLEEFGQRVSFKNVSERAKLWSDRRLTTVEAVERYLRSAELGHHKIQDVLVRIGISRLPTLDELWLYEKWQKDFTLTHEDILAACAGLTRFRAPSLANLDKLLTEARNGAPPKQAAITQNDKGGHKQTPAHQYTARKNNDYKNLLRRVTDLETEKTEPELRNG